MHMAMPAQSRSALKACQNISLHPPLKMTKIIKAELHCHTVYSQDSSNCIPQMLTAAREIGLDRLTITDHNEIKGAWIAKEMDPELVIVGEEILTERGELLAYYISEKIPKNLSAMDTIKSLKDQGAFIAIPHVFDRRRHGWLLEDLLEVLPYVDALEVFNARCFSKKINDLARAFAESNNLPMIAGSDAHSLAEVGLATVTLPEFNSADELRVALKSAAIEGRLLSPMEHLKTSALIRLGRLKHWKK